MITVTLTECEEAGAEVGAEVEAETASNVADAAVIELQDAVVISVAPTNAALI
jgi:hypothetical protein